MMGPPQPNNRTTYLTDRPVDLNKAHSEKNPVFYPELDWIVGGGLAGAAAVGKGGGALRRAAELEERLR
jgi:hypothetical protein